MADKIYGLLPYQWQPPVDGRPGYHHRPAGVIGGFDWRPLPAQGTAGQSSGYGLFAFSPATAPGDLIALGIGDCRTIVATPTMRNELRLKLGLSRDPAGAKLVDLIADICGPLSVPDGSTGVKTFMPTRLNEFDLHLAGHSKVYSQKINAAELLSNNPRGHANKIRDVIRKQIDHAANELGMEAARKMLGERLIRCGYHKDDVANGASGKASEWKRLLSPSLANRGDIRPARPATTHNETWPNIAADVTVTAQDQTWEKIAAMSSTNLSAVSGNLCQPAAANKFITAFCLSAVSSVDHATTVLINAGATNCTAMVTVRNRTGASTFYSTGISAGSRLIWKYVEGALTIISSGGYASAAAGSTIGGEIDGSTITGTHTGLGDNIESDSAISDGVRGGVYLKAVAAAADTQFGAWSISDVVTAAGGAGVSAQMLLEGWL